MGANYDIIVSPANSSAGLIEHICDFLRNHGFNPIDIATLHSVDIRDDRVILVSPIVLGRVEVLASYGALKIQAAEWFGNNPLAAFLSTRLSTSIHFWSLDSGYVAGCSVYANGERAADACLFSKYAASTSEIMPGVPIPFRQDQSNFRGLDKYDIDFSSCVSRYANLEICLGKLISQLGFDVHLVDFHEAIDEQQGIAIDESGYRAAALEGWGAILY